MWGLTKFFMFMIYPIQCISLLIGKKEKEKLDKRMGANYGFMAEHPAVVVAPWGGGSSGHEQTQEGCRFKSCRRDHFSPVFKTLVL